MYKQSMTKKIGHNYTKTTVLTCIQVTSMGSPFLCYQFPNRQHNNIACQKWVRKLGFFSQAQNWLQTNHAQIAWFKCQLTYLVEYTMDDWQNNQQGHHNLCKKRQMDKDKSLLGATDIVFVFMGWHLGCAFHFIG